MEDKVRAEAEEKEREIDRAMKKLEEQRKQQEADMKKQMEQIANAGKDEAQMKRKLEKEKEEFETSMRQQEVALQEERQKAKEDLEKQMRSQLNDQQRMQQFKEIDSRLQEIVPKIAEINTICREIGRESVFYEPEIVTDVKTDGTKESKVVVRVYPNRADRDESGQIPWDTFTDTVYFEVKDLYEDAEEKDFDPK